MSGFWQNIIPDKLSGIIFALEGIRGVAVLLNGPTGCKFYHSATAGSQTLRDFDLDPLRYPENWYFGQARVPCTFLDRRDYVYGGKDKLLEAMQVLPQQEDFDLLCIVNSPGAALIGDDLAGIAAEGLPGRPCLTIQTPGFSESFAAGYELALSSLLHELSPPMAKPCPKSVNLLGLSIYHRNWEGDVRELKRLLALCGISVNCALGAGCAWQEYQALPQAALNVVIYPEYGQALAERLKDSYGTPIYCCPHAPVGFDATEDFVRGVAARLDADPAAALAECERARARAYIFLSRLSSLTGLPKGAAFGVEGVWSEVFAYAEFLVNYLGMAPAAVSVLDAERTQARDAAVAFLARIGRREALHADILTANCDLLLASGSTIARRKLLKQDFCGLEVALPTLGYTNVLPQTYLGVKGALTLVEAVINGVV